MAGTPIWTVGDIRRALCGRADDTPVLSQVMAADGTSWLMRCSIAPVPVNRRVLVIDLRHEALHGLDIRNAEAMEKDA